MLSINLHDVDIKNLDIFFWLLLVRTDILNLVNDVQSLGGSTKDGMLAIQPRLRQVNVVPT